MRDLNIRPETLKQLQKAVGNTLEQIRYKEQLPKQNFKDSASKRNNEQMGLH
jgi:hypothetical protein